MWTKTYSKTYTGVSKAAIWHVWADVNNWPTWHRDLEYCMMEGSFEVGNYFMLKPEGIKAVKVVLTQVEIEKSFTDCTTFIGAKMYDTHSLEITPEGIKVTNSVMVTGPLQWVWTKLVAQNVAATAPAEMDELIKRAKELDA